MHSPKHQWSVLSHQRHAWDRWYEMKGLRKIGRWVSSNPAALIAQRRWLYWAPPPEVMHFPSMLLNQERHLLYWLALHYFTGSGALVDAGSFLGGSFYALAAGMHRSLLPPERRRVECYDTFIADDYMRNAFPGHFQGIATGESFRHRFEALTQKYAKYRSMHAGSIEAEGWNGGPIEIAVLDVLKSWKTNDSVCQQFFPAVLPGRGLIIHQDYVHEWCPWILITMEYLREYVTLADVVVTSAVFVVRKQIPVHAVRQCDERMMSHADQRELLRRATARFRGTERGVLECCRARLLLWQGDNDGAASVLEQAQHTYANDRHVQWCALAVRRFIASGTGYVGKGPV